MKTLLYRYVSVGGLPAAVNALLGKLGGYKGAIYENLMADTLIKNAQSKSISTVRKHPEKYGVKHFIKFGDYNVGREGNLLTLPTYMQFLLDLTPEDIVLEPIDMDELTRLAREALGK